MGGLLVATTEQWRKDFEFISYNMIAIETAVLAYNFTPN